jgi:hypothetical protein
MSFDAGFDRRTFLAVTGGAAMSGVVAPLTPAAARGATAPAAVMIGVEEAGDLGALAREAGATLVVMARADDPVLFWRREVAPHLARGAPLAGVTLWSDYLVFRGFAAEARLKLVSEGPIKRAPLIAWRFA